MSAELTELCEHLKKAGACEIHVLFCQDITNSCDHQLVVLARSRRHAQTLAHELTERMEKGTSNSPLHPFTLVGSEGWEQGQWIALDYQSLIIHILDSDTYEMYQQQGLWHKVPAVEYKTTSD